MYLGRNIEWGVSCGGGQRGNHGDALVTVQETPGLCCRTIGTAAGASSGINM